MLAIIVFGVMMALVIAMFVHSIVRPPEHAPIRSSTWSTFDKKRWSRGIQGAYPTTTATAAVALTPTFAPISVVPAPPPAPTPARSYARAITPDPRVAPDLTLPPRLRRDRLSPELVEHDFLAILRDAPDDVHVRMVYADWLEQRSRLALAGFVRNVGLSHDDIRLVIAESDPSWRALTCRDPFNCSTYACTRRWDALEPVLDDERVRICRVCERTVRYCETMDDVRASAARDESTVLDIGGALSADEPGRSAMSWDVS